MPPTKDTPRKILPASQYETEYLRASNECPVCHSDNIVSKGAVVFEYFDDDAIWQPFRCLNPKCRAEWHDVYNLVGIDNLTIPEPEVKNA